MIRDHRMMTQSALAHAIGTTKSITFHTEHGHTRINQHWVPAMTSVSVPNIADIGDPAAPVGSREWCKYHHGLCLHKRDTQSKVSRLKYGLIESRNQGRWQKLTDRKGRPFISCEDYVQYPEPFGLGMSLAVVTAVMAEKDDKRLLADVYQHLDAEDRANQRPAHRPKKSDDNTNNDVISSGNRKRSSPTGNSAAKALRTLRDKRPDIHARVLAGELSPRAGMIEAVFRKKRKSKRRRRAAASGVRGH
jgi:hypothetical protein